MYYIVDTQRSSETAQEVEDATITMIDEAA